VVPALASAATDHASFLSWTGGYVDPLNPNLPRKYALLGSAGLRSWPPRCRRTSPRTIIEASEELRLISRHHDFCSLVSPRPVVPAMMANSRPTVEPAVGVPIVVLIENKSIHN